jgi:hypothetical protein
MWVLWSKGMHQQDRRPRSPHIIFGRGAVDCLMMEEEEIIFFLEWAGEMPGYEQNEGKGGTVVSDPAKRELRAFQGHWRGEGGEGEI